MKIYESKLAHIPGHILWTFCFYLLCGIIIETLFLLTTQVEDYKLTTFIIVAALWLGQSWRFHKMRYKVNDDVLVQYDFQTRSIHLEQIYSIRVLNKMKWISFHTPYNMVIETIDKNRYFIAPQDVQLLVDILKKENPEIILL